ncbi:MAG: ABC transporter permease [Planctomycetes bacterium]|nr:ABC transporter permease [Planctomycetota bacterium]
MSFIILQRVRRIVSVVIDCLQLLVAGSAVPPLDTPAPLPQNSHMPGPTSQNSEPHAKPLPVRFVERIGQATYNQIEKTKAVVSFIGGATALTGSTLAWIGRALSKKEARIGRQHIFSQMVRVGLKSIPIIFLVEVFIGIILCLQMAPTLKWYGQLERVADIVAIAMFRELGPLLAGIVLSGFAGASIAAELGTMVEGEEIKALRAIALNPVRFLVVPRFLATVIMLTMLTVLADVIAVFGGFLTSVFILDIEPERYLAYTRIAVTHSDFISGIFKAAVSAR